jgi:hypothetical protein
MDALKFAFEILIVGALALPWLGILIRMFSPDPAAEKPLDSLQFFMSVVPKPAQDAVAAVVIIAIGYLLGSAVSRVSRNFFNDELWGSLPTEDQIRHGVYFDEYCSADVLRYLNLPQFPIKDHPRIPEWLCNQARRNSTDAPGSFPSRVLGVFRHPTSKNGADKPTFDAVVQEMFRLQEGALLLNGQDKVDRLKQYFDQITVLRGAALNGIILFSLCAFGVLGNLSARWSGRPVLKLLTFLPAGAVTLYGLMTFWLHWNKNTDTRYTDPPLAELVLLLLGGVGLLVISKAKHAAFYFPTCVVAAILTAICFGGWWWTEVMYDLQVIHSVPELQLGPHDSTSQANVGTP